MDLNLPQAGKEAVDETAKVIIPELDPIIQSAVQKLIDGFRSILVGRTITIVIK